MKRRTANGGPAQSPVTRQSRHPRLAKLVWPSSISAPGKEMITHFCALSSSWLDTGNLHLVAQFLLWGIARRVATTTRKGAVRDKMATLKKQARCLTTSRRPWLPDAKAKKLRASL